MEQLACKAGWKFCSVSATCRVGKSSVAKGSGAGRPSSGAENTTRSSQAPSGSVKERLASWLRAIAEADPYQTLGVRPGISDGALRERYLELARQHHPDRGGDADAMRRVNDAYEQVLADREGRRLRAGHGSSAGRSLKAAV